MSLSYPIKCNSFILHSSLFKSIVSVRTVYSKLYLSSQFPSAIMSGARDNLINFILDSSQLVPKYFPDSILLSGLSKILVWSFPVPFQTSFPATPAVIAYVLFKISSSILTSRSKFHLKTIWALTLLIPSNILTINPKTHP